jgi:hypothetical protein
VAVGRWKFGVSKERKLRRFEVQSVMGGISEAVGGGFGGSEAVRVEVCYDVGMSAKASNRASAGPSSGICRPAVICSRLRDLESRSGDVQVFGMLEDDHVMTRTRHRHTKLLELKSYLSSRLKVLKVCFGVTTMSKFIFFYPSLLKLVNRSSSLQ